MNKPPRLGEIWLDRELLHSCGDLIGRYRAVPLVADGDRLRLGMLNPEDQIARDDFNLITGYEIDPVPISQAEFAQVEAYLLLDPPEVISMDDFPEEAYQSDTAEAAGTADYVLELALKHQNVRVIPAHDHLLCYYDEFQDASLRFPGFVRNAVYRRWKQQAGLSPDQPAPCQGRIKFQGAEWDLQITAQDQATLKRVT